MQCQYMSICDKRVKGVLHPCPDVDIAAWNGGGAEEDVPAVATRAIDLHGRLAAVRGGRVEGDAATLVAVWRIRLPLGLVPSSLEVVRDLTQSWRSEDCAEGENVCDADHGD